MAKNFRKEWERKSNAEEAANAYAEAEFYKQTYEDNYSEEADDFSAI